MKNIYRGLFLLGASLAATSSLADSIDFNMHSDAFRLTYEMNLGASLSGEVGVLYSDDERRLDDTLWHAGFFVSGQNWSESGTFDIHLGARALHTSPGDLNLSAVAPGMKVRFSPIHRVGFGGHLYYAPSITSFNDAERYREYGVSTDYQLLPQAFVYVGFRYIDVAIEDGPSKVKLEDDLHVGFRLLF